MSSYLQHALLKNPVKWLRQVPKRHESNLYLEGYYNNHALENNPFAQGLVDTRMDVSKLRYPMGNMVQIVVQKSQTQKSQEAKAKAKPYELVPVLHKPAQGQNPATYLMNNRDYIRFLSRKRLFLVPSKYRHRSSSIIGSIAPSEQCDSQIERLFRDRIDFLLNEMDSKNSQEQNQNTHNVIVRPSATERLQWELNSVPVLHTSLVDKELSLSYAKNCELISLLLKYVSFVSV